MESSKGPKEGRDTAGATGVDDTIKSVRVQENLQTHTNEKETKMPTSPKRLARILGPATRPPV